jgi:uncharacterized membrane protein
VNDWLAYGLAGRDPGTVENCTILSQNHVIPALGARKLRDLSAEDIDRWLAAKAKTLSTLTLQMTGVDQLLRVYDTVTDAEAVFGG